MNHGFETIFISGGLQDGVADIAQFGVRLERADGESVMAFRARAHEAAVAAGSRCIVFGGLPPMNLDEDHALVDIDGGELMQGYRNE